jgi:hypothetical protein
MGIEPTKCSTSISDLDLEYPPRAIAVRIIAVHGATPGNAACAVPFGLKAPPSDWRVQGETDNGTS